MFKLFARRPLWMLSAGLLLGLCTGVGMLIGVLVAVSWQPSSGLSWPETRLHASASHSGETFAMATGALDPDAEALFMLDYLTGDLQCWGVSPRLGTPALSGKINVLPALGVEEGKKPNYVMVTGGANFMRGAEAGANPGSCVVYVADANTGNFVAFGAFYNRTALRAGVAQTVLFKAIGSGKARALAIRDSG
jgi:hypothetical protein